MPPHEDPKTLIWDLDVVYHHNRVCKMGERWRVWLPSVTGLLFSSCVEAANTFEMTWSTQSFGPDGPWKAVQIQIGSEDIDVSM